MDKDQEIEILKRQLHARNYMLRNIVKDIRDDLARGGMARSWEHVADTISAFINVDGSGCTMETAPKDGTEVILQVKLRAGIPHKFLVGHYMPGGYCIEDHPEIDAGWYFWNGCMFDKAAEPERWWPLPNAVEV